VTVHHADVHSNSGAHSHEQQFPWDDEVDALHLVTAYDRLTTSLQIVSAQFILLTADQSPIIDPRDAWDASASTLREARSMLDEVRATDRDRRLVSALRTCLIDLEALSDALRSARGVSAGVFERDAFVTRLRDVASRLARCADSDRGLRFFGSGGCGDAEHRFLHI